MHPPRDMPARPGEPAWDVTFTRMASAMRPRFEGLIADLARRFRAIGLGSDATVQQTPRGLSAFLALVGGRGLICIVDLTLVDGMAVGQGRCAALDIRLLDACGDVAAQGLAGGLQGSSLHETSAAEALQASMERAATVVYVAALAQFDLLRPAAARLG